MYVLNIVGDFEDVRANCFCRIKPLCRGTLDKNTKAGKYIKNEMGWRRRPKGKRDNKSSCWRLNSFTSNNSVGVEVVLGKALSRGWVYDCGLNIQQSLAGVSCSAKGRSHCSAAATPAFPELWLSTKDKHAEQMLGTKSPGSNSKPGMPGRWISFPSLTALGWIGSVWWGGTPGQCSKEEEKNKSQTPGLQWLCGASTSQETCTSRIKLGWNCNIASWQPMDKIIFLFICKWYHRAKLSSELHYWF